MGHYADFGKDTDISLAISAGLRDCLSSEEILAGVKRYSLDSDDWAALAESLQQRKEKLGVQTGTLVELIVLVQQRTQQ